MKTSLHPIFCFAVALSVTTSARTTTNADDYSSSSAVLPSNLSTKNNLRHHKDDTTANRRRRGQAESSSTTATCSTEISERGMGHADVKRSAIAARLSSLVYKLDEDPYYAASSSDYLIEYGFMNNQGSYYASESTVDAAYTVQINNEYCAVAFCGTTFNRNIGTWIQDLWSNLIVDPTEYNNYDGTPGDESDSDSDSDGDEKLFCDIHRGYYEAYFDFEYINEIETFLDSCHNDCPECDILFTGHSQGGSIAEVAGSQCFDLFTDEERCNWYHYILAMEGNIGPFGRGLVYDPFPMLYPQFLDDDDDKDEDTYARNKGLAFVGHEIFISSNDRTSMLYGAFNDHRPVGMGAYGSILDAHNVTYYADVLEELSFGDGGCDNDDDDDECFIPAGGFSIGSVCNIDDDDVNTCADGLECKKDGWWMFGPQDSCQQN
ncbi:hypothetical protein FRACYDRAFT_240661 [Fragilariopsis cylindrus CCMP1102]|uniref:Fungal lipase-type domain-containing protein n=1 Tax=Fragilariopsis cylindrus CCMP1102 TaxID=635003 RepID=A0A1E7FCV2_9STRA|nr:hypothetical protein FRACYDRAFT_240661 [Fragilariopsis cylindrus CCMP1102]|eukprot:OEU15964.1 hypothetical protein FRACYDRAFT_240661 [Fragilariopsis cylindrus CCMP1102]